MIDIKKGVVLWWLKKQGHEQASVEITKGLRKYANTRFSGLCICSRR
jgi:hypothetical protein